MKGPRGGGEEGVAEVSSDMLEEVLPEELPDEINTLPDEISNYIMTYVPNQRVGSLQYEYTEEGTYKVFWESYGENDGYWRINLQVFDESGAPLLPEPYEVGRGTGYGYKSLTNVSRRIKKIIKLPGEHIGMTEPLSLFGVRWTQKEKVLY